MTKLDDTLDRFSGDVMARAATIEDLPELCEMAVLALVEYGNDLSHFVPADLAGHLQAAIVSDDSQITVVDVDGKIAGTHCAAMMPSDAWDSVLTGSAWFLYVRPEHRDNRHIVFALLEGTLSFLREQGALKIRTVLDPGHQRHIERYSSLLGMQHESTVEVYTLRLEDS